MRALLGTASYFGQVLHHPSLRSTLFDPKSNAEYLLACFSSASSGGMHCGYVSSFLTLCLSVALFLALSLFLSLSPSLSPSPPPPPLSLSVSSSLSLFLTPPRTAGASNDRADRGPSRTIRGARAQPARLNPKP